MIRPPLPDLGLRGIASSATDRLTATVQEPTTLVRSLWPPTWCWDLGQSFVDLGDKARDDLK
jgi:hypothetical protein